MSKVSVIVTTYNVAPYIEKCLRSILDQSYKNIEIVFVDDASTDETLALAEDILKDFPDSHIIALPSNTPGGVGIPANIGLMACTGEYIAFADGDDWYHPTMIADLVEVAVRDGSDTVMANYLNYDESSRKDVKPADAARWDLLNEQFRQGEDIDVIKRHILKFTPVPWRKLYRHDFILKHDLKFPEGDFFFEDNPLHWFATIKASKLSILNSVICHHRVNRPGQTMRSSGKELLYFYRHYELIRSWLIDNDIHDKYEIDLICWIVSQIEWTSQKIDRSCWHDLFCEVSAVMTNHAPAKICEALARNNVGNRGWSIVLAAQRNDVGAFIETLLFGPKNYNGLHSANERAKKQFEEVSLRDARTEKGLLDVIAELSSKIDKLQTKLTSIELLTKGGILFSTNATPDNNSASEERPKKSGSQQGDGILRKIGFGR